LSTKTSRAPVAAQASTTLVIVFGQAVRQTRLS